MIRYFIVEFVGDVGVYCSNKWCRINFLSYYFDDVVFCYIGECVYVCFLLF